MPFNDTIPQLTTTTSNHADNFNAINNKLLENTKSVRDSVTSINARVTTLESGKVDKTAYTADKGTQATKDSGQDARLSSLESGKVDKTTYATDKTTQANKDKSQDDALTAEATARTTADTTLQTNIDAKATLDGSKSNFDFIENKVVQDGLLYVKDLDTTVPTLIKEFPVNTDVFSFSLTNMCMYEQTVTGDLLSSKNGNIRVVCSSNNTTNISYYDGSKHVYNNIETSPKDLSSLYVEFNFTKIRCIINKNKYVEFDIEGKTTKDLTTSSYYYVLGGWNGLNGAVGFVGCISIYNRQLTQQEIQHNLSVLNNSPSINQLQVTDSANQTSILYGLGAKSYHVEMNTGRTLEEEYMGVLEGMAQEYTSTGSPITVNDALNARLVGATIDGQTVKNITYPTESVVNIPLTGIKLSNCMPCEVNKPYTIAFYASNVQSGSQVKANLDSGWAGTFFPNTAITVKDGLNIFTIIPTSLYEGKTGLQLKSYTATFDASWGMVFDGDLTNIIKGKLPFGLSSTVATISNGGIKYPFYEQYVEGETVVQKRAKGTQNAWVTIPNDEVRDTVTNEYRLYSASGLGSVPSITDKIDCASKKKIEYTKEIVLNGSENWIQSSSSVNTFYIENNASKDFYGCVSDKFKTVKTYTDLSNTALDVNVNCVSSSSIINGIGIKVEPTVNTIAKLKTYLQANPLTVRYQLATPTETQLTDTQFATYTPYKKQISLGKVGEIADKLTMNSDGSVNVLCCTKDVVLNGSENWKLSGVVVDGYNGFYVDGFSITNVNSNTTCICNQFVSGSYSDWVNLKQSEFIQTTTSTIGIRVLSSKFATIEQFKTWLAQNPLTVRYQLATPTTTYIPKEVNAPVLTNQSNILSVESSVAPSKFSVKVPMNIAKTHGDRLKALESVLNTQGNTRLLANFVDDEYNKIINEVM